MAQWLNLDFFKNIGLIFNPAYLTPNESVDSIADINFEKLKEKGIENIIFDVDQTLVIYHGIEIHEKIKDTYKRIKDRFNMCILSNYAGNALDDKRSQRQNEIEKNLGIRVITGKKKKPAEEAYEAAFGYLGPKANSKNTAMIGDRLFTDIIGANKAGLYTIWVKPFDGKKDPLYVRIPRRLENVWYHLINQ